MRQKEHRRVLRVFIASPSDLSDERSRFSKAIEEVNHSKANPLGIHLEATGGEDALPGRGRPQALINKDVESCDLFVLLLWKRWGTPSGTHTSGTEEEFELARHRSEAIGSNPDIWLYFKKVPDQMLADPGEQLKKVLAFRSKIESERSFLYKTFEIPEQWEREFRLNLSRWIDDLPPFTFPPSQVDLTPEFESRLRHLLAEGREKVKHDEPVQVTLSETANALARRALEAAKAGRLTEAETFFASSLEPRWSPQNRPYGVTSKPAIETGPRRSLFYPAIATLRK